MLRKLTIRNFKAIRDMTIEFTPLTVLIGGNGCGKSTVLQAIDFLRSAATRDIPEYLRERGWEFADLKSQMKKGIKQPIMFSSLFEFQDDNKTEMVEWDFSIDLINGKWQIQEELRVHNQEVPKLEDLLVKFDISSSVLKIAKFEEPGVCLLQHFLAQSKSYDLLSVDRIRIGKRGGDVSDIGSGGEHLAHYIHACMNKEQRQQLNKMVSNLIGSKIEIKTADAGKTIILYYFDASLGTDIDAMHMSDGLLRMICFTVIAIQSAAKGAPGLIMLDEIEDGINPYLTEKVVALFRDIIKDKGQQIILTSHSPIILDDIKPEEVIFLWKNGDGASHSKPLFSLAEMKEMLEYLNPGEAWTKIRQEDLIAKMEAQEVQAI
jgi:predicted ATPase